MRRIGRRQGWWLIALAIFALCAGLHALGALRPLDDAFADQRARWLSREVRSDIVIVGMDAASLAELGAWPWPRRHHAQLLDHLTAGAPRSVFFDIDLSALSAPADDAALEMALNKPRDFPVILPAFLGNSAGSDAPVAIREPRMRFAHRTGRAIVNTPPAHDGLTRSWRTSWDVMGRRQPSVIDDDRRLPDGYDVIIDYSIAPASFDLVSYADVLAGSVPREFFTGKDVFVGATAEELGDRVPVPVHHSLPGIVVQALATQTVRDGAPRPLPAWVNLALLAAWTCLVAFALAARGGPRWLRNFAVLASAPSGVAALSVYLFQSQDLWLEVAAPSLAVILLFVAGTAASLKSQGWRALAYFVGVRRRHALLTSVVQSSTDCIVCVDEAGIIQTANPAASRLFDCPAYELMDEPISKFITLLAGEDIAGRLGALQGAVRECDARTARGEVFPVEISLSRVRLPARPLYTAIVRDIRERRAQQRRLQHQATHDSLTGLPNRAALLTYLEQSLSARAHPSVALLMLDLCRFKEVNDTLGHDIGDRVLCEVAQRFANTLGGRGFIARIGGDEFTVVLPAAETELLASLSQQLADCLGAPIEVAGISVDLGVSIGIARAPQDAPDAQALLRHADMAMYAAKRRGAPYEFHDATHDENIVRRLAIGTDLRAAIAGNQLEMHYQPQVSLRSGLVESCEALVRWRHPRYGAITPAEFIAVAESTNVIRPLTEWTLSSALSQLRAWRDRGLYLRVAVNLSARLLQDTAFPARLQELLVAAGSAAGSLELDITESAVILDPARTLRVIREIDRLGVRISIDDFGTGYSSLAHLRSLPVKSLKLDKSFVMGMRRNGEDRLIVESAAKMAQALKLDLVGEGVESDWDAAFLKATGYNLAQGFLYSRALPADPCMAWMVEFNATAMLTAGDTLMAPPQRPVSAAGIDDDLRSVI